MWRTEVRPRCTDYHKTFTLNPPNAGSLVTSGMFLSELVPRASVEWILVWASKSPCELRVRDAERQLLPAVFGDHLIEALGEPRRN